MAAVIAVVIVGALAAGWFAAALFTSPAQIAAERRPVDETPITVAVTRGDLSRQATIAVVVGWKREVSVPIESEDSRAFVTASPAKAGEAVRRFASLLEVNGRPRLLIDGHFSLYRTLSPGMTGPDVRELQVALHAAGYDVTVDGQFGAGTAAAITAAYEHAGYEPPMAPGDGEAQSSSSDATHVADAGDPHEAARRHEARVLALPPTEFVVAPAAPATITSLPAVGSSVTTDTTIGLGMGDVVATADVTATVAAPLRKGMKADFTMPDGSSASALITAVASVTPSAGPSPAPPGADTAPTDETGETWRVTFTPKEGLPADSMGAQAVATVEVSPIASQALIVPTTAVVPGAAGPAHVLVQRGASFVSVDVREVGVLDGRSAVEPVAADALAEGDLVRVR